MYGGSLHFAHTVKDFFKHAVIIEPDYTAARVRGFADGREKLVADRIGEAGLCAAAGAHKTFPMVRIESLEQQKFHRAARFRRWPKMRAGMTRVVLRTSTSPGRRWRTMSVNTSSEMVRVSLS